MSTLKISDNIKNENQNVVFHNKTKNSNDDKHEKLRLDVVKGLVPKGTRLLDIGTDHASLPIDLVKRGVIDFAIASDVNEKPLERAKAQISKNGLEGKIKTVLSNGFENIDEGEFDTAAICGMGGHLIAEIIEKGKSKSKKCNLILQPMSYPEALRKYLYDNGFEVFEEQFAFDNNKPYVIIFAKYTGIITTYTYGELLFGKFRPDNYWYRLYENKLKKRLFKRLIGIIKHWTELKTEEKSTTENSTLNIDKSTYKSTF